MNAMQIAERIRRCRYCEREMDTAALAYEENPYCMKCFDERTQGAAMQGPLSWRIRGRYVELFKKES